MRSNVFLSVLLSALIAFSTVSFAQEGSVPGLQVRNLLVTEIEEGAAVEQAASEVALAVISMRCCMGLDILRIVIAPC